MRVWLKDQFVRAMPDSVVERVRNVLDLLPPGLRYGKNYNAALQIMIESEAWDESDFIRYQEDRLEQLITHCCKHVPYYGRLFSELGLSAGDIQSVEDLSKLPVLDKEQVRRHTQEFVADNVPFFQRGTTRTSGSTGAPLTFYLDEGTRAFERALSLHHMMWLGWTPSSKVAYLNPRPGSPFNGRFSFLKSPHELKIPFRAMNDERMETTVKLLKDFKPDILSAWPSSLYLLARWMSRRDEEIDPPKYLITSSESLFPHVRKFLEEFYGARIIDFYGQEECVVFAMQCEYRQPYHAQMLLGIPEMIPIGNDRYDLLGTSLHNFVMPMLRYHTGDVVHGYNSDCSCGRPFPLIQSIEGRNCDFIVTPEKMIISPLILNYCVYSHDEIRESQMIQEDANTLRILLTPWDTISDSTRQALAVSVQNALETSSMRIIIEETDVIANNSGCKKPFIVSHINVEERLR